MAAQDNTCAPVIWGVLGCAEIATARVIPAMQASQHCVEWSVRALNAGKHVLCENPLSKAAAELAPLLAAQARCGLHIEEAFMVREHPQWNSLLDQIRQGRLGQLRSVQVSYSHTVSAANDIRMDPSKGGGALLDVGCYAKAIIRLLLGRAPLRVWANVQALSDSGVDLHTDVVLDYGRARAQFTVSIDSSRDQHVIVVGTQDWARVEVPFAHPDTIGAHIAFGSNVAPSTEPDEIIEFKPVNQYALQATRFSRRIRDPSVPHWTLTDAQENMHVLDAIRPAAHNQHWVVLPEIY